jgi:hypothetical protein
MNKITKTLRFAGLLAIMLGAASPLAATPSLAAPMHGSHAIVAPVRSTPTIVAQNQFRDGMVDRDRMPPLRAEYRPAPPHRDFVWHKGHWRFDRGHWVWMTGLYLAR